MTTQFKIIFFTLMAVSLVMGCAKPSLDGDIKTESLEISEFTAFHPVTGLPLTASDLNSDLLKEDEDPIPTQANGLIETKDVHPANVDVEGEKDSMLFGWDPKGEYNSHISAACHFSKLEDIIGNQTGMTSDLASTLQRWSNQCDKELSRFRTNNLTTVIRFVSVNYDVTKANLKKVSFNFEDGTVLKGLLAMKEGDKKRPLVIFKIGIYGDAVDSGVFRNFLMNIYEESPFHFLFLGSVTGEEYAKDNGVLALGGLDEGRQIIKVADMMTQDESIKEKIEDVHVAGVSLGSNGVLFSSLYNSFLPNSPSKIKSAMALCPVVNLEKTMKSVFELSVRGIFYSILTNEVLRNIYDYVPVLRQVLDINDVWTREMLYEALTKALLWYYKLRTENSAWDMEPFNGKKIETIEDFWNYNNFITYVNQVKTPTLVVHAKDDFLVKPDFNSEDLLRETQNFNSNVGVFEFENGSHCGFNVGEGWATTSSLLRAFVLKHSSYTEESGVTLPTGFAGNRLTDKQTITKYAFDVGEGSDEVEVKLHYYDSKTQGGVVCSRYDPRFAPSECYTTKKEKIKIRDIASTGISMPVSKFESLRLTRWLNTHAILKTPTQQNVLSTNSWPNQIQFTSSYDFSN